MAYVTTATFQEEQVKLSTSIVDMYCLNASQSGWDPSYYANWNHNVQGYQINGTTGDIKNVEQLYTGLPIRREALQSNIQGEIPGLTITIPNTDRAIESLIQNNDYLRGLEVHIISFFTKHLPSGSGYQYIGSDPDYNAGLKEKFYIDGVTSNQEVVSFTLRSKFNIRNVTIPRRRFTRDCSWVFKSTECNYSGADTTCMNTLASCREKGNSARFGGFVSIPNRPIILS